MKSGNCIEIHLLICTACMAVSISIPEHLEIFAAGGGGRGNHYYLLFYASGL